MPFCAKVRKAGKVRDGRCGANFKVGPVTLSSVPSRLGITSYSIAAGYSVVFFGFGISYVSATGIYLLIKDVKIAENSDNEVNRK